MKREDDANVDARREDASGVDHSDGLDELVHRASSGAYLSPREELEVMEHLRACITCAFLVAARADLRREDALAVHREREQEAALVAATLAALGASDAPDPSREAPDLPSPSPSPSSTAWPSLRLVPPLPPLPPLPAPPLIMSAGTRSGRTRVGLRLAAAAAAVVVIGVGGFALARLWPRTLPPDAAAMAPSPAVTSPTGPRIAAATPDAAQLFAWARDARVRGDAASTKRRYEELWARFPATPEALAGRAILGRWLLDRGEPAAALSVFADYLWVAPEGPLGEEVRVGIAESWDKLGRVPEGRAAWRSVVTHHPGSPHVRRARERLLVLERDTP